MWISCVQVCWVILRSLLVIVSSRPFFQPIDVIEHSGNTIKYISLCPFRTINSLKGCAASVLLRDISKRRKWSIMMIRYASLIVSTCTLSLIKLRTARCVCSSYCALTFTFKSSCHCPWDHTVTVNWGRNSLSICTRVHILIKLNRRNHSARGDCVVTWRRSHLSLSLLMTWVFL
jgi:hypothetical protein